MIKPSQGRLSGWCLCGVFAVLASSFLAAPPSPAAEPPRDGATAPRVTVPVAATPDAAFGAAVLHQLRALQLLAVEPTADEAVFRLSDAETTTISEGTAIGDTGAWLVQVLADRVVLRLDLEGRRQTVWMFRTLEPGKPGAVRVVDLTAPEAPIPATPEVPVEVTSAVPTPPPV